MEVIRYLFAIFSILGYKKRSDFSFHPDILLSYVVFEIY